MSQDRKKLHLNVFLLNHGHHEAAWRREDTSPQNPTDIRYFVRLAQIAEEAKFDSLFLADLLSVGKNISHGSHVGLEPLTLLSALATVTEHIGLIGTVSTTFNEPFNVARKLASLDHISGGRVGWNIVTSGSEFEAANFNNKAHLDHAIRYARAGEFVDVAIKLWDSWDDDAIVFDREAGIFADDSKVNALNHTGTHFHVKGPLNVPRSPQGRPVLVQAGSSEGGREFAAKYADAIFTAQQVLEEAQQFYTDVKQRVSRLGRNPDEVKILPGICPIIAATEAEAKEKEQALNELTVPAYGLNQLKWVTGIDLSSYPLDGPLPELPPVSEINGNKSRYQLIADLSANGNLTIRQLIHKLAGGRGHRVFAGTAVQVADQLEEWFIQGACDGFNVMPPYLPAGLEDFAQLVVPELQRRGLFRTEYESRTLRGNYGLPRPNNRWAALNRV